MYQRLAPALLALAALLAGCGLAGQQPSIVSSGGTQATGQPLSGGMIPGGQTWQAAATATPTLRPPAPVKIATVTQTATAAPTDTPAPAFDPACLLGSWEAANLAQALGESLVISGSSLALEGVEGQVRYRFNTDGTLLIDYQGLTVILNGTLDGRQVRVIHTLNGSGSARYSVDALAGEILLSEFGGEGINSSLEINGQVLAEGSLPVWQAFAAGPAEAGQPGEVKASRTAVTCQDDSLTLQAVDPALGPVVGLFRTD